MTMVPSFDINKLTQDDGDLMLHRDEAWCVGSLWCSYLPVPVKQEPYFYDLLTHFDVLDGVDVLWSETEHLKPPRALGEMIDRFCHPSITEVLLIPEVDLSEPVYEASHLKRDYPIGKIRLPGIEFIGLTYSHEHRDKEMTKARSILEEKMIAIEIVRDS